MPASIQWSAVKQLLLACSCTAQTDLLSAVTSLARGAGGRGLVCLGPTLGFRPNMTQGRWANAPCWARTRALAGQFTSLRLSNVPPRVLPRKADSLKTKRAQEFPWFSFPFFHTPQSMTHRLSKLSQQHTPSSTYTHILVQNHHAHTHTLNHTPSFTAHLLSRTTFTYNSLTVRSYTISFVYASFPCALHLLFYL